ncbi:hypothetical protein J5N97_018728 [Dioscorea zingiberensis]|uniref:YDG domain-containing protein n=1 Tax=Dioscorea zingiberensis TaxID=325984 RepID=A0A9D5CD76_9LILI|nr:hypothetical protein J5N97_018728 [Dioscorea zingiberensis]
MMARERPLTEVHANMVCGFGMGLIDEAIKQYVPAEYTIIEAHLEGDGLSEVFGHHSRPDLKAAALMTDKNLWLNRDKRINSSIPGVYVGDIFFFHMELCIFWLHGQVQAGIDYVLSTRSSGNEPVATSIIVFRGYEDDDDRGEELNYTGHDGRDGKNSVDQKLERGNLALERVEFMALKFGRLYMGMGNLKLAEELKVNPSNIRPTGYLLSLDISMKKEKLPVMLFNDLDDEQDPMFFDYLVKPLYPPSVFQDESLLARGTAGCGCVTNCSTG